MSVSVSVSVSVHVHVHVHVSVSVLLHVLVLVLELVRVQRVHKPQHVVYALSPSPCSSPGSSSPDVPVTVTLLLFCRRVIYRVMYIKKTGVRRRCN